MTPEQQAAYIVAMSACVNAEVAAMQASNQIAAVNGRAPQYDEQHFLALLDKYGVHHNAVMGWFR